MRRRLSIPARMWASCDLKYSWKINVLEMVVLWLYVHALRPRSHAREVEERHSLYTYNVSNSKLGTDDAARQASSK